MKTNPMKRAAKKGFALLLSICMLSSTALAYDRMDNTFSLHPADQNTALRSTEYTLDMEQFQKTNPSPMMQATGNHTPQTAQYLSDTDMNAGISQTVSANPDWYYFELTGDNKLSSSFYQEVHDGQYTLTYYKLNQATGDLTELATSTRIHTYQRIIHMDTAGIYFLKMDPVVAPTTQYLYNFIVCPSYNYDSYEYNDYPELAPSFTDSLDIYANIDSPLDEDYYKLILTDDKTVDVTFTGVLNHTYTLELFKESNGNLNYVGSMNTFSPTTSFQCSAGTYYVYVRAEGGAFSDAYNYHITAD